MAGHLRDEEQQKQQNQIEEMKKDLTEIFDEEYESRKLITPQNTAEKLSAKGYCNKTIKNNKNI